MKTHLPQGWTLSAFTDEAGSAIEAQIEAARRADLSLLDLRSADGFNISVLPLERARNIKAKLDEAGLRVQMLGSPLGKSDIRDDFAPELQKLRHLSELAPILGCNWVRVFSYYNAGGAPKSQWQDSALDRLTKLKSEARSLGLRLYHENERHIFGDLGADVARLAELRGDDFALIFDFDNFNQSGEDVWATWELLCEVTDAFHLKDSTAQNQHVPAGQGQGQIERILSDALSRGWRGPLAVEPHLSHSGAVAATSPSGAPNETFASMAPAESFHVAAVAAQELLMRVTGSAS
jgi:sugar phosphate isomerase/epimerase